MTGAGGAAAAGTAWLRRFVGSPRRLRTPLFMQSQVTECGAACLGSILAHFGRWVSPEELRQACMVGRDGCTALDIVKAARRYGLDVQGWRREPRQLRSMSAPMILFWSFSHFVVLEGVGRRRYYLNDPASGRRTVDPEEFDREFTGVVLSLKPGTEFRRGGNRPGVLRNFLPWLRDARSSLRYAALSGLLLAFSGLVLPALVSVFVDHVLGSGMTQWGGPIVAIALATALAVYLLTWLHYRCLSRLAVRLSVLHADGLLAHLFRLPMEFFSHRLAGDIIQRIRLVDTVAATGSKQVLGVGVELVMSLLFLALMLAFDPLLGVLVVAVGAASTAAMKFVSMLRTDANRQMQRERGMLDGTAVYGLRNIASLRATGREDEFFARWAGYQARELLARQRFSELGYFISALPALTLAIGGAAVFGLGGLRAMAAEMTIGQLMGFYVVAGNFLRPVGEIVLFADVFQTMEADLQRLDDVESAAEDPAIGRAPESGGAGPATLNGRLRLNGRIEIRNLTFGYQRNQPPLIDDLSLIVEVGQRVAVVGPSGSGKSTLLLLLSGTYSPWRGEILLDGVPVAEIPRQVTAGSVSLIDQRVCLFSGTVRDNLTLWDPTIPDEDLIAGARDALAHEVIASRPKGYDGRVEDGGRNFSGGQRQRLEIARALVRNPSVLLLDEATSALDTLSEQQVDDAIRRRGCTSVIVAHRLSTIRDSDLIVVLDGGREVERGVHDDLIAAPDGLYARLFESETA